MMDSMKSIRAVPEAFYKFMDDNMEPEPVWYKNRDGHAECFCGKCRQTYRLRWKAGESLEEQMAAPVKEKPARYQPARCERCGHRTTYEWKRVCRPKTFYQSFYFLQRTKDNDLVMRIFRYGRTFCQAEATRNHVEEERRYVVRLGTAEIWRNENVYVKGEWEREWRHCIRGSVDWQYDGMQYSGWQQEIAGSNLKYFDMRLLYGREATGHGLTKALIAYANNPWLEQFAKMGMTELVTELIGTEGISRRINRRGNTLKKQLRLKDMEKIRSLVEKKGSMRMLEILQWQQKTGRRFTKEQEDWLFDSMHGWGWWEKVKCLLQYMTIQQLMNRCQKYRKQWKEADNYRIVTEYLDYIRLREELGYDMSNEVYVYPKNLKKKHAEMVREKNARRDELYITEKTKKFPEIPKRHEKLRKKYEYRSDGLVVRPAGSVEEIIMEGRLLHHCVGGDTYLGKHDRGESFILFLRKEDAMETPYVTIEIAGNRIVQWYGKNDEKPDRERIDRWLEQYTGQIGSRKRKKNKGKGGDRTASAGNVRED